MMCEITLSICHSLINEKPAFTVHKLAACCSHMICLRIQSGTAAHLCLTMLSKLCGGMCARNGWENSRLNA